MLNLNYLRQKLISCSKDQTIKFWDLDKNQCINTPHGHTDQIWAIEKISGNLILSCSNDTNIKLWDLDSGLFVKQYFGRSGRVNVLKMLNKNSFASGSYKEIKFGT